jgi:hypothetical protein
MIFGVLSHNSGIVLIEKSNKFSAILSMVEFPFNNDSHVVNRSG